MPDTTQEKGTMSRRTLDFVFAGGGAILAVLLLVLGFVLADQASFARSYVKNQLGEQKISFTTADKLTDEEKTWKSGSVCLIDNAGKMVESGKQAECYANYYIALHVAEAATNAGFPGQTYATLGGVQATLRAQVADAKGKGDTAAADAAQQKLDSVNAVRSTAQTGETLRGLLLTSYGFSIFGEKAALAGDVCFVAAALLILLAAAGFIHAFRTPPDEVVGAPASPKPGEPS
jgi:hypothetical protein